MKKKLFVLLSAVLLSTSVLNAETIDIKVKGMVCSFCAQGLDKKFRAEPSVFDVAVSLKKKSITLKTKEGETLTNKQIEEIVKDGGYDVQSIKRK